MCAINIAACKKSNRLCSRMRSQRRQNQITYPSATHPLSDLAVSIDFPPMWELIKAFNKGAPPNGEFWQYYAHQVITTALRNPSARWLLAVERSMEIALCGTHHAVTFDFFSFTSSKWCQDAFEYALNCLRSITCGKRNYSFYSHRIAYPWIKRRIGGLFGIYRDIFPLFPPFLSLSDSLSLSLCRPLAFLISPSIFRSILLTFRIYRQ